MQQGGMQPDPVTFVGVVNACASIAALEDGKWVHEQIIQRGFESIMFVGNSLVDTYAKCASIEDALRVFNRMSTCNVVAWSAIILGHVKCGQGHKALELSSQMQQEGVEPKPVTFVGILNACASIEALNEGKDVHEQIIQSGWESNVSVGSSLVDMYAKCGSIDEAWRVFNSMPKRDVVAWNAMILGFAKCGQGQKALQLSCQMQYEGVLPVPLTFVGMLNACASVAALEEGRHIHGAIIQSGYESDVFVGSSLNDMYAKCGSVEDAWRVFNRMPRRNMVAWTAMLGAYAMHGHANEALAHFKWMCEQGVEIDDITFLSLLSACRHAGVVDEGLCYFQFMNSVYGISPTNEHYACVVDLLGRVGRLHDAEVLIKTMPCEPNATVWMALLGACRIHGNMEMGECIARRVLESDPGNSAGYVLLLNIYAAAGNWDLSATVQKLRLERGVRRQQGRTWIEVNNEVHTFVVDDQEHPQINEIHAELKRLSVQMKDAGYVPHITFMLHDVEEEEKLFHLCHHSKKLAIAYGLISTPPGTPIRIFKNLHVCGDCHSAAKFIAKLVGRAIIIRDVNQFITLRMVRVPVKIIGDVKFSLSSTRWVIFSQNVMTVLLTLQQKLRYYILPICARTFQVQVDICVHCSFMGLGPISAPDYHETHHGFGQ